MDSTTIKHEHAEKIHKALRPSLNYLGRLRQRMVKVGFPPDDELMQLVEQAYGTMHHLFIRTHYLSCKSGTCQSPSETRPL